MARAQRSGARLPSGAKPVVVTAPARVEVDVPKAVAAAPARVAKAAKGGGSVDDPAAELARLREANRLRQRAWRERHKGSKR